MAQTKTDEQLKKERTIIVGVLLALIVASIIWGAVTLLNKDEAPQATPTPTVSVGVQTQGATPSNPEPQPTETSSPTATPTVADENLGDKWLEAVNTLSGDELANALKPFSHAGLAETMRYVELGTELPKADKVKTFPSAVEAFDAEGDKLYTISINDGRLTYLDFTEKGDPWEPGVAMDTPYNKAMEDLLRADAVTATKYWANYDPAWTPEERQAVIDMAFSGEGFVSEPLTTDVPEPQPRLAVPSDVRVVSPPSVDEVPDKALVVSLDAVIYDANTNGNTVLHSGTVAVTFTYTGTSDWTASGLTWTEKN